MDIQIDKLTRLIKDLLDVTKIEQGGLQFQEETFDFNAVVTSVIDEIRTTTVGHEVLVELNETRMISGDGNRIGQVITNLLTNAIKYSPKADRVVVRTYIQGDELVFSVEDFGIGLSDADQVKVFERFYRAGNYRQETYPGLGLGLFISAAIIHRHNGRIWVESEKDKGSVFSFSLPVV